LCRKAVLKDEKREKWKKGKKKNRGLKHFLYCVLSPSVERGEKKKEKRGGKKRPSPGKWQLHLVNVRRSGDKEKVDVSYVVPVSRQKLIHPQKKRQKTTNYLLRRPKER